MLLSSCGTEEVNLNNSYSEIYKKYFQIDQPTSRSTEIQFCKDVLSTGYGSDTILNYLITHTGLPEWDMLADIGDYYWIPCHQSFYDSLDNLVESQINSMIIEKSGSDVIFEYDPIGTNTASEEDYNRLLAGNTLEPKSIQIKPYMLGDPELENRLSICVGSVTLFYEIGFVLDDPYFGNQTEKLTATYSGYRVDKDCFELDSGGGSGGGNGGNSGGGGSNTPPGTKLRCDYVQGAEACLKCLGVNADRVHNPTLQGLVNQCGCANMRLNLTSYETILTATSLDEARSMLNFGDTRNDEQLKCLWCDPQSGHLNLLKDLSKSFLACEGTTGLDWLKSKFECEFLAERPDIQTLRAEFDAKDKIDIGSLESLCPCLADYFKKLFRNDNIDGDNWLCSYMKQLDDSNLNFQGFELIDEGGFHNGDFPFQPSASNSVKIKIPKAACKKEFGNFTNSEGDAYSSAEIGAMFIHEFLHMHMQELAYKAFPDGIPNDLYTIIPLHNGELGKVFNSSKYFDALYAAFVNEYPHDPMNPHAAFLSYLKTPILESLRAMNGNKGNLEDYEYYFHLIINTEGLKEQIGWTDFNINDYLLGWQRIGGYADGSHPLFDTSCPE